MTHLHTPGPWNVMARADGHNAPFYIIRQFGETQNDVDEKGEHEANARLIAAAPELLEALIEVEQMIHANELNEGTMSIVREAINKAKGV